MPELPSFPRNRDAFENIRESLTVKRLDSRRLKIAGGIFDSIKPKTRSLRPLRGTTMSGHCRILAFGTLGAFALVLATAQTTTAQCSCGAACNSCGTTCDPCGGCGGCGSCSTCGGCSSCGTAVTYQPRPCCSCEYSPSPPGPLDPPPTGPQLPRLDQTRYRASQRPGYTSRATATQQPPWSARQSGRCPMRLSGGERTLY
jgi:hypothetical protein